jgi:hypothetical protein
MCSIASGSTSTELPAAFLDGRSNTRFSRVPLGRTGPTTRCVTGQEAERALEPER